MNLVDNQTIEPSAREYGFLIILAEDLGKGKRVHEGSKVNVTDMWDYEGRRWERRFAAGRRRAGR